MGISHFSILVGLLPDVGQISIDIKPGSGDNPINMKSNGKIPVAILSAEGFNAVAAVNQNTLTFGKTGDEASLSHCGKNGEDVNSDGIADLVCHFQTKLTGFAVGDTEGILKGQTWAGDEILGTDSVRILK
jgi:hypothetical protein